MDEKPTNAEVLLDGETVAGFNVRPWTISKCAALTPVFEKIAAEMKRRKLSFRDFFTVTKDGEKEKVEVLNLDQLLFALLPLVPEIISKTLDITQEEVDTIPQDAVLTITVTIVKQNMDYLKNLFALTTGLLTAIRQLRTD